MTTLGTWFRTRKHHAREVNDYLAAVHGPSQLDVWDGTPGPLTAARIDNDDDLMADCADVLRCLDGLTPDWDEISEAHRNRMLDRLADAAIAGEHGQRAREIAEAVWIVERRSRAR
jgi:hypothetical protein